MHFEIRTFSLIHADSQQATQYLLNIEDLALNEAFIELTCYTLRQAILFFEDLAAILYIPQFMN